ncbi:carboxymuconolactone decarboxylase family protein [Prauserella muralis]|uniref:Uncharacterized protein n=1 Tax=Prauserella muralis TaxID=588067 RepID=A0A2V4ATW7_9PSEU|nr:hypothetical protein [Prauserella muralis]PXY24692.1 hypothetical protein BAY60_19500 [Prauserella muralis]TWE27615.1 hypothetical protein FHX69_0252 [Prauserella muralis]
MALDTWSTIDARLRDLQPESARELDEMREVAWTSTDPVRLELCRLRLAALLGHPTAARTRTPAAVAAGLSEDKVAQLDRWPDSTWFDAADRAHLAFAEQFTMSVSAVTDEHINDLLAHLNPEQVCAFVGAVYVIEVEMRLKMVASALLTMEEVA